jgi:hypothetical protein
MAGHGSTRTKGLSTARRELETRGYDFVQAKFHGDVFVLNGVRPVVVRPKISSGKFGDSWPWDVPPVPREDLYLLILEKPRKRPKFWIVPSGFVRGALEGNHHGWYLARKEEPKIHSEEMRVLERWPIREFENRWDLLGVPKK